MSKYVKKMNEKFIFLKVCHIHVEKVINFFLNKGFGMSTHFEPLTAINDMFELVTLKPELKYLNTAALYRQ